MTDLDVGVTEQKYRELLERGSLIADTVSTAGWAELVAFVADQQDDLKARVLDGGLTHEAYIAAVEWLAGSDYVLKAADMFDAKISEYKNALAEAAEDYGEAA